MIACQKILKKFKKHFSKFDPIQANLIFDELQELTSKQIFSQTTNEMSTVQMRKEIKNFYAEYFTDGNKIKAKSSLQSRMKPYRKRDIFYVSFYSGMLLMQLFFNVIVNIEGLFNI